MLHTESGNAVIVAIDHGLHNGVYERFEDPQATLETLLETDIDGILAGIPFIRQFQDTLERYPGLKTIATIDQLHESTFPGESDGTEIHHQVFSVEEAVQLGADAIKSALVYGRKDPEVLEQNLKFVASASERARELGIPSVVEPTLWGQLAEDDLDAGRLANANRIAFELGADILKSPYPGDPASFEPIVSNSPLPVYIAGGPAVDTDRQALEMVKGAMDVGSRGVMIGRNIWQREDPASMIRAISGIVHAGATVDDVLG